MFALSSQSCRKEGWLGRLSGSKVNMRDRGLRSVLQGIKDDGTAILGINSPLRVPTPLKGLAFGTSQQASVTQGL